MQIIKVASLLLASALLSACSGSWRVDYPESLSGATSKTWHVSSINVSVPDSLSVSDENTYAPNADIVWHGDPVGDRRVQVRNVMQDGLRQGVSVLRGARPVQMNVELVEFHAVTPIAVNNAPGAVHNIRFNVQMVDARTGAALTQGTQISADLGANVGATAVISAQQGQTQKVRIRAHLSRVIRGWLGVGPDPRGVFTGVGR